MIKAKTHSKLIKILCAITSVVFAFIIGFTFAVPDLQYTFGTKNNVNAYLANQQYTIVNDTVDNPVYYGIGAQSANVSIQYSIDYAFDLEVQYSLSWTNSNLSTNNVILHFVNRDSLIVDDSYIYYASYNSGSVSGISAGSGNINLISSVEFVDVATTKDVSSGENEYIGQALTINIVSVKIAKARNSYTTSHPFYHSASTASKAWLEYKNSASMSSGDAYVMVYNYRHNYNNGIKYPGPNSAYKVDYSTGAATWLGGNRSFAGVGLFIITGNSPVKIKASVVGIWRTENSETNLIYENSILFNFADNWTHSGYVVDSLFEECSYNYVIPANTTCYLDILDSIEVTTRGKTTAELEYNEDSFRAVATNVTINGESFDASSGKIQVGFIDTVTATTNGNYSQPDVSVVNTSIYTNGLYDAKPSASLTNFRNFNIALTNNTASYKSVSITYSLVSHIGNGKTSTTLGENFGDTGYYSEIETLTSTYFSTTGLASVVLAPYSTIEVCGQYTANANLSTYINTNNPYNGYYDAWLELKPTISVSSGSTASNLPIETRITNNGTDSTIKLIVKNNTQKVVTNITASAYVWKYNYAISASSEASQPTDWNASFWQYYTSNGANPTANTNRTWSGSTTYYLGSYQSSTSAYSNASITQNISLQPNETYVLAETTVSNYVGRFAIIASASCTSAADASGVQISKIASNKAYLINYSANSYFVKFTGTVSAQSNITTVNSNNYYIGILRPNQIVEINLSSSSSVTITTIQATGDYVAGTSGTLSGWDSAAITQFDNLMS